MDDLAAHGGLTNQQNIALDFSANLNPMGMPDCAVRAAADSAALWERYPDPACRRLKDLLAQRCSIGGISLQPDQIVVGNGAADLIYRIVQALKPHRALLPVPSFSEYEKALRENGCEIVYFALRKEEAFDITEEFMSIISADIDLCFLCNPNNPTGRLIDPALLREIVYRCRMCGTVLVLDECFLPFAEDGKERSICGMMSGGTDLSMPEGISAHADRNLHKDRPGGMILLSAFTKLFAMPGLRLGFCICSSTGTAYKIQETGQYWSVSAPAQAAGEAILTQDPEQIEDYVNQTRALIVRERTFLTAGLCEAGPEVLPSGANFLLCRSKRPLCALLLRQGIAVRDCANFRGLGEGYFRIAVRTHAENERLLRAIHQVI